MKRTPIGNIDMEWIRCLDATTPYFVDENTQMYL